MSHPASYPVRCANCNKFMPLSRSQVVREYSGTQMNPECDDVEVGICQKCEDEHHRILDEVVG